VRRFRRLPQQAGPFAAPYRRGALRAGLDGGSGATLRANDQLRVTHAEALVDHAAIIVGLLENAGPA
jgi:hypothetical protein